MKCLSYQIVISLETQVGITSQRNKWANKDPRRYRRWDHMPRRSEHPLSIGRIHHVPHFKGKKSVVKISVSKLCKRNNPLSKLIRIVN
jgi:hypothetical protein